MKPRWFVCGSLVIVLAACAPSGGEAAASTAATIRPGQTAPPAENAEASPSFLPSPTAAEIPALPPLWRPLSQPAAFAAITTIAAGVDHTCGITTESRVMCWGNNSHGQLGDGTTASRNHPVHVAWLSGVTALAAGWSHTCALTREGDVMCWGYNKNGELGNGTNDDSLVPKKVDGLEEPAVAVAAGDDHTCAVTASGTLSCWGYNKYHQLTGLDMEEPESSNVPLAGIRSGVDSVAAGWGHTCTLSAGKVECWGNNEEGQLGKEIPEEWSPYFAVVDGLPEGVVEIAGYGGHTCARTEAGAVLCWGDNQYGQLGDGTTTDRFTPVTVFAAGSGITGITAGWSHTCAVSGGGMQCWGRNDSGQLGDGSRTNRTAPVRVEELPGEAHAMAAGQEHTCALLKDGSAACWGNNSLGQLGDSAKNDRQKPVEVIGFTGLVARIDQNPSSSLATGRYHTCAVADSGGVKCWGNNQFGQLGDGITADSLVPLDVRGLQSGVVSIAAGSFHTCAILDGGGVKCWGANGSGQLGSGFTADSSEPVEVQGLDGPAVALALGHRHSCALLKSGRMMCWGADYFGQKAGGNPTKPMVPAYVGGNSAEDSTRRAIAISAGAEHTCAQMLGGGIQCWGENSFGQIPGFYEATADYPVDIVGLAGGYSSLASGTKHSCALSWLGSVVCWGSNDNYQLGDGTSYRRILPDVVNGLEYGAVGLAANGDFSCAAMAAGGIECWGFNPYGQLGDGTQADAGTPVRVVGITDVVTDFTAGEYHACAIVGEKVLCWGDNRYGQLGNGTTLSSSVPIDIQQPVSSTGSRALFPTSPVKDKVTVLAAGGGFTCAANESVGVQCWGENIYGQLGDGTAVDRNLPGKVIGLTGGITALAAGQNHICALTDAGGVKCWGHSRYGQAGDGGNDFETDGSRSTPVDVVGLTRGVKAIAAGADFTCALNHAGKVQCWGDDRSGQLGWEELRPRWDSRSSAPVYVTGLDGVTAIAAGGFHACALQTDGGVTCWGNNQWRQTHDIMDEAVLTPMRVEGLTGRMTAIAAGRFHTCALSEAGRVFCWGDNSAGQLGIGTMNGQRSPIEVTGLEEGAVSIAAGGAHTCVLTKSDVMKCWGWNYFGQLGDGSSSEYQTTPVPIRGVAEKITVIAPGRRHTCALTETGRVYCWGYNQTGQLGDGTEEDRNWPAEVIGLAG